MTNEQPRSCSLAGRAYSNATCPWECVIIADSHAFSVPAHLTTVLIYDFFIVRRIPLSKAVETVTSNPDRFGKGMQLISGSPYAETEHLSKFTSVRGIFSNG